MISDLEFIEAVDKFPWESEVQRKGYLSFVQYQQKRGLTPSPKIDGAVAFLIQKSHESHEWHVNLLAQQIEALQKQICELRKGGL